MKYQNCGEDKKGNKIRVKDIPCDAKGWIMTKDFLPQELDLVTILDEKGCNYTAWRYGKEWKGHKVPADVKVVRWRKIRCSQL